MPLPLENHDRVAQSEATAMSIKQPFAAAVVFLEVIVASAAVVGFFQAASQPFGWQAGVQILSCAALGALLWAADAKLNADRTPDS